MSTIDFKLTDISRDDSYDFSFPQCPQRYAAIEDKFPGLPLLIVDKRKRVVWGHDYLRLLLGNGQENAVILEVDIAPVAALFLNFNLTNRLFGLNLYEKLLFVKKISSLCPCEEIRRRAELDFNLNEELCQRLHELLSDPLREVLAAGQLGLKGALRLLDMAMPDRKEVLGLFRACKFSVSQQLLIINYLEETAFREKKPLAGILAELGIGVLLEEEMPQQKIMTALQHCRYPAYAQMENEWQQWRKNNAVPGRLALAHVPFFEKEEIHIFLTAKNKQEAEQLLGKLKLISPSD